MLACLIFLKILQKKVISVQMQISFLYFVSMENYEETENERSQKESDQEF